jgi:mRNA interferase MazF
VNRGEVWWVERPNAGRRPHLVLTRDSAIPVLRSVVAVPATRTVRGIASEVALGPDDGMPGHCALTLDNVRAIPKAYFVEPICALGPERMASVCKALDHATGCR